MNWILKNKVKNSKALLVVLFLVGFFVFLPGGNAKADEVVACNFSKQGENGDHPILFGKAVTLNSANTTIDRGNCCAYARTLVGTLSCAETAGSTVAESANAKALKDQYSADKAAKVNAESESGIFMTVFKKLLIGVFNVVGWLFAIAATIFSWAIDPANISSPTTGVLNKQAVKDVWVMVRDLLNMTFILILLFAAFCTIFQVDKWNLKKVWLSILINALLVNFSYPIARFFVDVSNVAFYYLVNHMFSATGTTLVTGNSIFANFAGTSGLGQMLSPSNYSNFSVAYLIMMIIVVFIMGMTLMVIAGLFIVRLIALIMLVMFSPIGFVGYIFPKTESYANEWWEKLFAYSFFAPIMIFIMAVAFRVTEAIGKGNMASFNAQSISNSSQGESGFIAQVAFFSIPIILLWAGIGTASSMKIAMAKEIVDGVKKGGKWLANAPGHYSGVYGGTKKAYEEARKSGKIFGMQNWATKLAFKSGVANREAGVGGFITGGPKGWKDARNKVINDENRENIDKDAKKLTDSGMSVSALNGKLNSFHSQNELNDKEWKEQAAHAKAYMAEQADDRKLHIQNNIGEYRDLVSTDPTHLFRNMDASQITDYQAARTKAEISHTAITNHDNGTATLSHGDLEGHVKQVAFFANKAAKEKLKQGVNAANRK